MKLIIDIGNSRTKFYIKNYSFLDINELFKTLLSLKADFLELEVLSTAIEKNEELLNSLKNKAKSLNIEIKNIEIIKAEPEKFLGSYRGFGADRFYKLLKASEQFPQKNIILIDFGTATTYSAISSEGVFLGGFISPSIYLSLLALHEHSSALPEISEEKIEDFWIKFLKNPKSLKAQFSTTESMIAAAINSKISEIQSWTELSGLNPSDTIVLFSGSIILPTNSSKITVLTDSSVISFLKAIIPDFEVHIFDFFFEPV
jgi:pantothenate kinase type III